MEEECHANGLGGHRRIPTCCLELGLKVLTRTSVLNQAQRSHQFSGGPSVVPHAAASNHPCLAGVLPGHQACRRAACAGGVVAVQRAAHGKHGRRIIGAQYFFKLLGSFSGDYSLTM